MKYIPAIIGGIVTVVLVIIAVVEANACTPFQQFIGNCTPTALFAGLAIFTGMVSITWAIAAPFMKWR